jgi:multidrug efflux pump
VDELMNHIVLGVLLVVGVLMLFLGLRNAVFVGLAIPMSMFISFTCSTPSASRST